jgi:3-hydroxyacyl-CoA dehydrogenase
MHFMNPVPVMKLVEVIRGLQTSDETTAATKALAETMGKTAVECRDFPGFVSNRVLMPLINEAIYCLHEGVADANAIDTIMKLGMNHPMGPLTLADFIGLDTCLYILEVLHEGLGEDKYRPCPLLRKHVEAGGSGRRRAAASTSIPPDRGDRARDRRARRERPRRAARGRSALGGTGSPRRQGRGGGKPEAAARRELREETGLDAAHLEPLIVFVHDYPTGA